MQLGVSAPFLQHLVNDLLRTPKDGTSSAPARVLLIEDDADLAAMACEYLTRDGFDVSCATDGVSATRAAADGNPDLVVLDIGLPDTVDSACCASCARAARRRFPS